jgi:WhiB family redox-sensing transcriptional regulator
VDSFLAFMRSLEAPWMRDGLCREPAYPRSWWFPSTGETSERARAVCARCAVRDECSSYAITEGIEAGIWGGLSPKERRGLGRQAA